MIHALNDPLRKASGPVASPSCALSLGTLRISAVSGSAIVRRIPHHVLEAITLPSVANPPDPRTRPLRP